MAYEQSDLNFLIVYYISFDCKLSGIQCEKSESQTPIEAISMHLMRITLHIYFHIFECSIQIVSSNLIEFIRAFAPEMR